MYLFYEFIYFFMHMMNRQAFGQLTEAQSDKLREYVGPFIVGTAVDYFFAHWPADLKEKLTSEFYDKLDDAQLDYSTSRAFTAKSSEEMFLGEGDDLLSKLARNVTSLMASQT